MAPECASRPRPRVRLTSALLGAGLALAALVGGQVALAAGPSGVVVIPRPTSGPALSYFKLGLQPGHAGTVGAIELRNPTTAKMRVVLAAVDGQTINTLGSTYAPPGSQRHEATRWVRIGRPAVTLAPNQSVAVPVSVSVPANAKPGDYLAGVSVEALDQQSPSVSKKGVSIASVVRYAIGVEISLPGPRRPLIGFTGARLERQPAGLAFLLLARNPGNAILQNVQGTALITKGARVVARTPLGPGTFVAGTSIAYPVLAPRERPAQGTVYRVRAELRYTGGIARLDTRLSFGHAAALRQQEYGGPKVAGTSSGMPGWLIGLLGGLGGALALGAAIVLWRRKRAARRSPLRTLNAALRATRETGEPLSLITIDSVGAKADAGKLAHVLRGRLRQTDRLCRLKGRGFLVVAPGTDIETANALASDLRRHAGRTGYTDGLTIDVHRPDDDLSGAEVLAKLTADRAAIPAPSR